MAVNCNKCLTRSELILVAETIESGEDRIGTEADAAKSKYQMHVKAGCVDCEETVEALLLISRAASTAMERVVSRYRQGRRAANRESDRRTSRGR